MVLRDRACVNRGRVLNAHTHTLDRTLLVIGNWSDIDGTVSDEFGNKIVEFI